MRKFFLSAVTFLSMSIMTIAQTVVVSPSYKVTDPNGRAGAGFQPVFYVFPDTQLDESQAKKQAEEMNLSQTAQAHNGSVIYVNPKGKKWSSEDLDAFKSMVNGPVNNIKLIGIGRGATFVNNYIASDPMVGAIAGMASIDGEGSKAVAAPVPVYLSGKKAQSAAKAYIKADDSKLASKSKDWNSYQNQDEELLRVFVSNGKSKDLATEFNQAWEQVLSRNYRFNNYNHTWYNGRGIEVEKYGNYELEPYVMFDQLGITRVVVEQPQNSRNAQTDATDKHNMWLWYEYLPQGFQQASDGTVPMVVLLHGNTNDPRTQAETSGFVELAAEEHFLVVEMEWQGNDYGAMGLDGIETTISNVLRKYPQVDPSRIYAEGLSAGSMTATSLGIRKSYVFAAVGGHSGGIFGNMDNDSYMRDATQKRGAVEMPYCSVSGTEDQVVAYPKPENWKGNNIFNAWMVYQTMNGMPVVTELDFSKDATFGQVFQNRKHIETNKGISIEMGQQLKDGKPLLQVVAVNNYGHWNFKPTARIMWDYFKQFSRDQKTLKLIYTPSAE